MCGNPGDPFVGAIFFSALPDKPEQRGRKCGGAWKSETPIVAKNAGNAAGAKGSRFNLKKSVGQSDIIEAPRITGA